MFQCWELATTITTTTTSTPNTKPLSGNKHGSSGNKRQRRKFVLYKNGLVANTLALLVLFLFLSIHSIGLVQCGQVSPSSVPGLGKAGGGAASSSGKEGTNGRGGLGALDDSELSSAHYHHHHNYHRHHRHSSSGKNLPSSSSSSSSTTSASYGYQPEYSPLNYYSSDASYYEPRYYDRPSREFSARSTSYPAMAAAASTSQVGFAEPEYGGLALASGHGGGHGHGGHGHGDSGYGHGHHTTYYKTVNKLDQSSLGLLGLLGLLSLLSNVLMLLTTTARSSTMMMAAAGGMRVKRDTMMLVKLKDEQDFEEKRSAVVERLSRLILPSLNIVGHAKNGRIPLNCTYQEVCKTNKALVQVFGAAEGRPVAAVLSTAIVKLLTNKGDGVRSFAQGHSNAGGLWRKNGNWIAAEAHSSAKKFLITAGLAGRNGEDCELIYPTCNALSDTDDYSTNGVNKSSSSRLPFLVSPEHALAIILGRRG